MNFSHWITFSRWITFSSLDRFFSQDNFLSLEIVFSLFYDLTKVQECDISDDMIHSFENIRILLESYKSTFFC